MKSEIRGLEAAYLLVQGNAFTHEPKIYRHFFNYNCVIQSPILLSS